MNAPIRARNESGVKEVRIVLFASALATVLGATAGARAQDADVDGRTAAGAAAFVSAIADMAGRDVAGAICADSRHRRARVLADALEVRARRLRAAVARRDESASRAERAVIAGLLGAIRELHAEAATCVGEAAPATTRRPSEEPAPSCVVEVAADVPHGAIRPPLADAPRSAVSE